MHPAFNSSFVDGRCERHGRVNTAVINPPQVTILAVGSVKRSPMETATGGVAFRDVAELTLTADHRAIYGADAARFLGRLRQLLEHPLALVL